MEYIDELMISLSLPFWFKPEAIAEGNLHKLLWTEIERKWLYDGKYHIDSI
jgi:hypothetical protein